MAIFPFNFGLYRNSRESSKVEIFNAFSKAKGEQKGGDIFSSEGLVSGTHSCKESSFHTPEKNG
jgi:hypothetical protein